MMKKLYVRTPTVRRGQWVIVIAEGSSPLDKELEVIQAGSRESAWQTYRRIKKDQGKML